MREEELIWEAYQLLMIEEYDNVDTSLSNIVYRQRRIGDIQEELEKQGIDLEEEIKKIQSKCNKLEPCKCKDQCTEYTAFLEGAEEPPCIKLTAKELRLQAIR